MKRPGGRWCGLTRAGLPRTCRVAGVTRPSGSGVTDALTGTPRDVRTHVIGALLGFQLIAVGLFECSVNADVFLAWVKHVLLPQLPPAAVILLDNATFHKRADIQKALRHAGHTLEYLPPYSPDLNPIEHKWAQAKAIRKQTHCAVDHLFRSNKI